MTIPINHLDEELIRAFWNRKPRNGKQLGRIDLVVNVANGNHYLVPVTEEHKDFVPRLPCTKSSELVPYWMQLRASGRNYLLSQLVVGASSYEAERGVRHSIEELANAGQSAWDLIARTPIIVPDSSVKFKILKPYACKD